MNNENQTSLKAVIIGDEYHVTIYNRDGISGAWEKHVVSKENLFKLIENLKGVEDEQKH